MRLWIIGRQYKMLTKGLHFAHAGKGGRVLLREEVSWRNINGVWLNAPWWCVCVEFRRVAPGSRVLEVIS